MIRRLSSIPSVLCSVVLCSAAFVLAGCTSKVGETPATPKTDAPAATVSSAPKVETPKAPAQPTVQPAAGSVIGAAAKEAEKSAAVAKGIAKEAEKSAAAILSCSRDGCTKPGIATIKLEHGGKTFNFCCAACRTEYKKANNLE